jgi:tetratricopeptide (TPR) repeat protein
MRRLNVRLLLVIVAILVVGGGAVQAIHVFQVRRHTGAFLREADRAEQAGDTKAAADYLKRYLLLVPEDADALVRLARLYRDDKRLGEALALYTKALSLRSDGESQRALVDESRRALVDLSMHPRVGRYQDAQAQLEKFLLPAHPDDLPLLIKLGICQEKLGDYNNAGIQFEAAIARSQKARDEARQAGQTETAKAREKDLVEATGRYADLLVRHRDDIPEAAKRLWSAVATSGPLEDNSDANLILAGFVQEHAADPLVQSVVLGNGVGKDDRVRQMHDLAIARAKKALEAAPDDPTKLLFVAQASFARGDVQQARECAERAMKVDKTIPLAYTLLTTIYLREGKPDAAVALLSNGLDATRRNQAESPLLLWNLAKLRIDRGELVEAGALIERLKNNEEFRPIAQYLQAQVLVAQSTWPQATRQLELVAPSLARWPDLRKESLLLLARCYERSARNDLRITVLRAALDVDPSWAPARLALGQALQADNETAQARIEYARVDARSDADAAAEAAAALARLDIRRNIANMPAPDWKPIERAIEQVAARQPINAHLLRAELAYAQGDITASRRILNEAVHEFPKVPLLWTALVALELSRAGAETAKGGKTAEHVVKEMQSHLGDCLACRLARGQCLLRGDREANKQELRRLAEAPATWNRADRLALARAFARASLDIHDYEQAGRLAREVADAEPGDMPIRLMLFEVALQTGQPAAIEKALEEVRVIEGEGAYWHYGEALRLTLFTDQQKDAKERSLLLGQAAQHLAEARSRRPNWSRIPAVLGEINERSGAGVEVAIDNYTAAFDQGERSPKMVARLIQLLVERKEFAKVESIIGRLRDENGSADLARLASQLLANSGALDEAERVARRSLAESRSTRDYVLLAHVLRISKKDDEAEQELREATRQSPKDAMGWVALVQFYAKSTKDPDKKKELAREALKEAAVKLESKQAPIVLAYGYDLLGQSEEAGKHYDAALAAAPDDVLVRRLVTEFKLRAGKRAEAEKLLRELLAAPAGKAEPKALAWGRRMLAQTLASERSYPKYLEACALIEQNLKHEDAPDHQADRRTWALVLASYPTPANRKKAIHELEDLARQSNALGADDRLFLAQLQHSTGQSEKAAQTIGEVAAGSKEPRYLAPYVEIQIQCKKFSEAQATLDQLNEVAKNSWAVADLRARLLAAQGRAGEALDVLVEFKRRPPDANTDAAERRAVAARFEAIGRDLAAQGKSDDAQKFFAHAERSLQPAAEGAAFSLDRLGFFVRRGRNEEAVDEFARVAEAGAAADVTAAAVLASSLKLDDAAMLDRLDGLLAKAARKHQAPPIWMSLASLRDRSRRYDAAEESYRRALALDPNNVVALNNLAYLLGVRNKNRDEALAMINRAIEQAGPRGSLLDSRAVVKLALGRKGEALADAEAAVQDDPAPAHLFHQARLQLLSGQAAAAGKAWQQARQRQLTPAMLHALEADAYRETERELGSRK